MLHTKEIEYKGHSVTCGAIYQLKVVKGFSDYAISTLFDDVSESTIWRRRKMHTDNGDFYEGSTTIF